MAALSFRNFHSALKTFSSNSFWRLKGACCRVYSVYPPDFIQPIIQPKEIEKIIKQKSSEEILATRIRPATNSQNISVFYHPDVEIFINYCMRKGNRDTARNIVFDAFTLIKHIQLRKYNSETDPEKKENIILCPVQMFLLAVKNVTPLLWYMKIKRSGTWYKIPIGIPAERAKRRGMKWIFDVSRDKDKKVPLEVQMAHEIIAAANYEGRTIAKKIELHKMCEANRGYANYWWT